MAKKTHVATTINGEPMEFLCEARQSLLEVLRDNLAMTGSKEGCNNGNCGACTVLLDGQPVDSCLVLAVEAEGAEITTVEGIADDSRLHPIQQCFLEEAALQCGVCTPGFIVTAKALLDRNPTPSEHEIRFQLAGNLCRCTGYDKIIRAVQDAGKRMAAEARGASTTTNGSPARQQQKQAT
ncbi:MAG: (2Fe-2S)-binding protein [Planctomycetota bacterium]|nr:MAG: (2Fe-2S)-binding protein [Planctomycetota bacterium]